MLGWWKWDEMSGCVCGIVVADSWMTVFCGGWKLECYGVDHWVPVYFTIVYQLLVSFLR